MNFISMNIDIDFVSLNDFVKNKKRIDNGLEKKKWPCEEVEVSVGQNVVVSEIHTVGGHQKSASFVVSYRFTISATLLF